MRAFNVKREDYFYSEGGVCVAMGGGEVLVWDCSVPGVAALVEELTGHLPVDRTHESYLRESARKVIREVAHRIGKVRVGGIDYWVADYRGEGRGGEWVYTPDREMAKILTPHMQAQFRAYGEANELDWKLVTI
jgi:hypothetical protein